MFSLSIQMIFVRRRSETPPYDSLILEWGSKASKTFFDVLILFLSEHL